MKNTLLALTIAAASSATFANSPLPVKYGQPAPLGAPVQASQSHTTYSPLKNVSLNGGYTGSMIDEGDVKLRFKGWELGATYFLNEKGGVYNFYDEKNVYINGTAGLGYAWVDGSSEGDSVDLEYLTIPVGVEVGYKFTPNFALYGGLGYKWLYNQQAEACLDGECYDAGKLSELDVNGTTYRAGLRYNF